MADVGLRFVTNGEILRTFLPIWVNALMAPRWTVTQTTMETTNHPIADGPLRNNKQTIDVTGQTQQYPKVV